MDATFPSLRATRVLLGAGVLSIVVWAVLILPAIADSPEAVLWILPPLSGVVAGAIAFRCRPQSMAGRRLLLFGVAGIWFNVVGLWLLVEFDRDPGWALLGPLAVLVQVIGLATPTALVAAMAVYPDGRYHARYEAVIVRVLTGLVVAVPLAMLVVRPTIEPPIWFEWTYGGEGGAQAEFPPIDSPLFLGGPGALEPVLRSYFGMILTAGPLLGAVLVALRYRRLRADGRLQIRWPLYGVAAGIILGIEGALWQVTTLPSVLSSVIEISALVVIAASLAIGLVRPDLFDIDTAVLRVLVFFPLWLLIAAASVGVAAMLGLAAAGQGLEVALVVAIVATVAFEPVRRLLTRRVGRWAYGDQVGGEELLRRLGSTLEHTHDLAELTATVAATAREGLGVAWVRITVAGRASARDGATYPAEAAVVVPLVHGEEPLGELACGPRPTRLGRRGGPPDPDLVDTLARQVALAVHNALLAEDLAGSLGAIRRQAEELAASRSRLVAAEETARRRLERDIHDGAQQELVALIASIGLAQNQLRRGDPGGVGRTLTELAEEARGALDNLRTLSSGIHPAVLSDHGLVAAVQSRADALPLPVTLRAGPGLRTRRFGEQVEGTAYFVVCESLANALKHADAHRIQVAVDCPDGHLELSVTDDGRGFVVGDRGLPAEGAGSGLAGLGDRLGAVGGTLRVESSPGEGTRVSARLPIEEPAWLSR